MAFLSRYRKEILRLIADELSEDVSSEVLKVPDLKKLILNSENYDEDLVRGIAENFIKQEERQAQKEQAQWKHELEIKKLEAEKEHEQAKRVQEQAKKEKAQWERKLVIKKLEVQREKSQREHELEIKKLEIAARASNVVETDIPITLPKVDWQLELRKFLVANDDISLYLVHFERVMKRVQMPIELWVPCLIIQLPSEIVQMIMREPEEQSDKYDYVKSLLLKRYKLSPEKFRQLFYSHENTGGKSWREFYHELYRNIF